MKILLVGEYNRSHKFLKDGLIELGHEALVVGITDGFKKVDVDIEITMPFEKGILKKLRVLIYKILNIDLRSVFVKKQIIKNQNLLSGFDVVQFINESSFLCTAKAEIEIFDWLTSWNKKSFLLSCGTDHISVKYAIDKKYRYNILDPYFEGLVSKEDFSLGLKHLKPDFIKLHHHIFSKIKGVISCDLDYYIPLLGHPKHLGMVPHPINIKNITYIQNTVKDKIVIFHGINRINYYKKGNHIFEEAISILASKYSNKIEIITVESVPYKEYIQSFDKAHIVLDQVYAYDQGYNALEAMAKGKVVFTGAEKEWLDYYKIEENSIAINALPDAKSIANRLEWLLLNPDKITEIGENARNFVEKEHNYLDCARRHLEIWKDS